jgi:outer membrane protein assembly factor BamB
MRRLLALALLLARPAAMLAADFPMFKGNPARLGQSPSRLGQPVHLAWKKDPGGSFYSSPAVAGERVYIANSNHQLYCYGLSAGDLKWKRSLPERVYGSSPQVEGGKVFIGCVDGCVYSLDAQDGRILGKSCVKRLRAFGNGPDILGSPLVLEGKLYFGSDNHAFYCVDSQSGKQLWSFETEGRVHDVAPSLFKNLVLVGSWDGRLYALDKDSGALAWKSQAFGRLNTAALVHDGMAYFGSEDAKFRRLDASTGREIWSYNCSKGVMSSPALSEEKDALLFGDGAGLVHCLGLDGTLKWKHKCGDYVLASPVASGPTAWLGCFDGHFYGFEMKSGAIVYDYASGDSFYSSAAVSGERIVVGGRDGSLYCFQASSIK